MNWPDPPAAGPLGDGRFAWAVDRPQTLADLRETVARRVAEGFAIYPQGGATSLDFGGVPRAPGVAIDTRGLSRVVDYPAADMTITVEAGITLATLQALLSEQGQRLPLDPPHSDRATLGGIFAAAACGPRRFGAGRPRDLILGVGFVTSGGALVRGGGRVVKNVAGYDLPKLLTGSLGTLGVIGELTLKVRPRPEAVALAWVPLDSAAEAAAALDRLNTSGTRPMALELLNGPSALTLGEPLGLPARDWVLIVGLEDNADSVSWQLGRLREELGRIGGEFVPLEGAASEPLWAALADHPAAEVGPVTIAADLRRSAVVSFCRSLDPARWALQAHAGNGIVRAHARAEAAPDLEELARSISSHRTAAAEQGGSLILPRCPTAWKSRLKVWGDPRPDWDLAATVKQALDPHRVMNPGRFVGTI